MKPDRTDTPISGRILAGIIAAVTLVTIVLVVATNSSSPAASAAAQTQTQATSTTPTTATKLPSAPMSPSGDMVGQTVGTDPDMMAEAVRVSSDANWASQDAQKSTTAICWPPDAGGVYRCETKDYDGFPPNTDLTAITDLKVMVDENGVVTQSGYAYILSSVPWSDVNHRFESDGR